MMATVRHVTSTLGLRKFQADGFLFDGVYVFTELRLIRSHIKMWCKEYCRRSLVDMKLLTLTSLVCQIIPQYSS